MFIPFVVRWTTTEIQTEVQLDIFARKMSNIYIWFYLAKKPAQRAFLIFTFQTKQIQAP